MSDDMLGQKINKYALINVDHKDVTIQEIVEAMIVSDDWNESLYRKHKLKCRNDTCTI